MAIDRSIDTLRRISTVAAVAVTVVILAGGMATAAPIAAGVDPFDGVVPDFTVLGVDVDTGWAKLLAGVWVVAAVVVVFRAGVVLQHSRHRRVIESPINHE